MEPIWDRLAGMGIRTVIGAASWAQVEPVEGTFDFSTVDAQIEAGAVTRHAPGADLVRRVQERRVDVRAGVGAPGCGPLSPRGRCRHGHGPVHLSGRDAEAGADGVLAEPARCRPPGVRPVRRAPGRRRPGPHRGDGPGRERGGPPPRQPGPVVRGRGGLAGAGAAAADRPPRGAPGRAPARAGRALGPAGQPEVRHVVGGLRRRLAGGRGLHGLGVRELLRRPRGRRQGGRSRCPCTRTPGSVRSRASRRPGTTRAVAPSAG